MSAMNYDYGGCAKKYFRYLKKEKKRHTRSLPNYKIVIIVFVCCILLLLFSFFISNSFFIPNCIKAHIPDVLKQSREWFSNACLSVSCGGITGLVLYFIANVRNCKQNSLTEAYLPIKETVDLLLQLLLYGISVLKSTKESVALDEVSFFLLLEAVAEKRKKIPLEEYNRVLVSIGYDPLDCDKINSYRNKINLSDGEASIAENLVDIMCDLKKVLLGLIELENEYFDQMEMLKKSFF